MIELIETPAQATEATQPKENQVTEAINTTTEATTKENQVTEATTKENQVTEATTNTMTLVPPAPTDLLQSLMKLLDEHIEKKVAEAVVKHIEAIRDIATEIAEQVVETAMDAHAYHYDHDDYDNLVNNIDEKISDAIYDYNLDDKIEQALGSYDMEDKIKDTIRDMSFTVSVD